MAYLLQNDPQKCNESQSAPSEPGRELLSSAACPARAEAEVVPLALISVKLITAIIRPERLPDVKAALFRAGVTGVTVSRVAGHGGEREVIQRYRAETVVLEFHDKVRLEMACSEPFVEPCVQAILAAARTGDVGDGKIFVQPLEQVIRIRTGERDVAALTPVTADAVQRRAREVAATAGAAAGEGA